MRPAGEIRLAVKAKAWELAVARAGGGVTFLDVMSELGPQGYGVGAVRVTLRNMARARELVPVGRVRAAHSCRPLVAYAPAQLVDRGHDGAAALTTAMRAWQR